MKHIIALVCAILVITFIQGCATKTYGRQSSLTNFEKTTMTCREMDLEMWLPNMIQQMKMGDFGIGNSLERTAALDSAKTRISQLEAQRQVKGCEVTPIN